MASSSTASIHKSFKYDVFLSFRGEDTRTNFIDHLYYALQQKSINTYKDDEKIKKGKLISDELIGSIQDSKFYIIVFSKNYASSSWCLDELVKIMECQKTTEHTAYPVFYDVEPTEVRNQIGAVEDAFATHENDESAGKWKEALRGAADLAGWELKKTADGHEAKFIQKIVEHISLELRSINFCFDEKLVGMDTRVKDAISYIDTNIEDVSMIGIKGMGGGGKTTLARAIFDQICFQFEGKCFVENVREVSKASLSGLTSLQIKVLTDVFNDRNIYVSDVHNGKIMIKKRMRGIKVLVVLDDVDDKEQLEALAGELNWFKPGSKIIITTRDEQVLVAHRVKWILNINLLSSKEAICLFSRYAFGRECPVKGYEDISGQVIRYAAGLPLTIRVLGSFLCGKNESEWIDALERLKTIPLKETLQILELSYLSLEEDYKVIFLNVACILKGWYKDLAIEALESCGFRGRIGLKVLEQKSLITVSHGLKLIGMHDHIEEMGRNIVRRLHPDKPNKHSRLWIDEEIKDILANELGTKATRYIQINLEKVNLEIVMKGLRKMKELRFLHVIPDVTQYFVAGERKYDNVSHYFPNALNYLHWYMYPLWSLPNTFQGNNLVALKMVNSKIIQLWDGGERKVLNKLKLLDLSDSNLTTLDLRLIPNLEELSLKGCYGLVQIHMLNGCRKLKCVDLSYSKLKTVDLRLALNLEMLHLKNCDTLVQLVLPDGCLKLTDLHCTRSKLTTLDMPGRCQNLRSLELTSSNLRTLNIGLTPNLMFLNLNNCHNLEELHMTEKCEKLISLNISHSKLKTLDLGLTPYIQILHLEACNNLVQLLVPTGCLQHIVHLVLSGCLRFRSFVFDKWKGSLRRSDESPKAGPLAEFHLIAKSLIRCPLHPDKTLRKFQFECFYKDEYPSMTRNLEMLISVGLCACTNLETFSGIICGLQRLSKLKLESYPEAPKDLGQLDCLEELILSTTNMKHLPDSICILKHLEILKLESCWRLGKLPEDLGRLECLKRLVLSSAMIKHLPDSVCMLKHLNFLNLLRCSMLENLPEDLGRLECLEWLEVSECKSLRDIPTSICKMKSLKRLDVAGTFIIHLPQNICLLKGLRISGSRGLLESYGFTSEIQTSQYKDTYYVIV